MQQYMTHTYQYMTHNGTLVYGTGYNTPTQQYTRVCTTTHNEYETLSVPTTPTTTTHNMSDSDKAENVSASTNQCLAFDGTG